MDPAISTAIVGVVGGTSLTAIIANYAIKRALSDLEMVVEKIHEIDKAMAAMFVHLNTIAEHDRILREHAKQLAFYEGVNDRHPSH